MERGRVAPIRVGEGSYERRRGRWVFSLILCKAFLSHGVRKAAHHVEQSSKVQVPGLLANLHVLTLGCDKVVQLTQASSKPRILAPCAQQASRDCTIGRTIRSCSVYASL